MKNAHSKPSLQHTLAEIKITAAELRFRALSGSSDWTCFCKCLIVAVKELSVEV